jgi:hypothetical protein
MYNRIVLVTGFVLATSCAAAAAQDVTSATAAVNCTGYNLSVRATDLADNTDYTLDYTFVLRGRRIPTRISSKIDFTAVAGQETLYGSGFWNVPGKHATVRGVARLTSSGSAIPITIDGSTASTGSAQLKCGPGQEPWRQQGSELAALPPLPPLYGVAQGASVALSADGNTAVVGAPEWNYVAGGAAIYVRVNGVWYVEAQLPGDFRSSAGESAAISADGNTVILGAPGLASGVLIFTYSGGANWSEQAEFSDIGGSSVSLSGDGNTAIVGDNDGARVFTRSGGVWTQQGPKLVGTGAVGDPGQGAAVALSTTGNTAIVGGPGDNDNAGAIWVFTRSGGVWAQQGQKLVGTGAVGGAEQGTAVALSMIGNTAIVGGPFDNDDAGAAWVFTRSGGVWTQRGAKLIGAGATGDAEQGSSVSLSATGRTAIIGGPNDDGGAGAAWLFKRFGGRWEQQGPKLIGIGAAGQPMQGAAVSLSADGTTAIIGGPYDGNPYSFGPIGAAWIFTGAAGMELAGSPDKASCYPRSVLGLIDEYHGLSTAAAVFGYNDISVLERAIAGYCGI